MITQLAGWLRGVAARGSLAAKNARALERFLERSAAAKAPAPSGGGGPVVVVVRAWQGSAIPHQFIAIARLLAARGLPVELLWDELPFEPFGFGDRIENRFLLRLLDASGLRWRRLSEFRGEPLMSGDELAKLAELNAVKAYLGESWPLSQRVYQRLVTAPLRRASACVAGFLAEARPRLVVLPGGCYSTSGVYVPSARKLGIRVATLDHGPQLMLLSVDGIAARLADIPPAFHALGRLPPAARQLALDEWSRRQRGVDRFQSQAVPSAGASDGGSVLVPLNQSHDTAALGISRLFRGQDDWLMQTTAWLLDHCDRTVIVRQHPTERIWKGNDDYAARLQRRFGTHPRLRFVAAGDPVNTYDLIGGASVVLPFGSTVGIEATMMGAPVVVESDCSYGELGFVWKGRTRDGYFDLIRQAMTGHLQVTAEHKEGALACYYLTQVCNLMATGFTPFQEDYEAWSRGTLAELAAREEVGDVLEALEKATPLALLRHRRLAAASSADQLDAAQ